MYMLNRDPDWDCAGLWEADGVTKIDGIGTQMHISYYENPTTQASKKEHVVKMLQLMLLILVL